MIRVGRVSTIDHAAGTATVTYSDRDNEVTDDLPMLANEYHMPAIGDQVIVLHMDNGDGVILGPLWSDQNIPPEGQVGIYRKDLGEIPGQAIIRYDGENLSIECSGGIKIRAAGAITINGSTVDIN